jgi:hypothetical protein
MDSIGMGGRFAPESVDELDRNMHDSEAEEVIAGIPGIGDEINIFRSVAVIRAAKAHDIIHRRTERALEKKWGSKGQPPMRSEDGELLIEALKQADAT